MERSSPPLTLVRSPGDAVGCRDRRISRRSLRLPDGRGEFRSRLSLLPVSSPATRRRPRRSPRPTTTRAPVRRHQGPAAVRRPAQRRPIVCHQVLVMALLLEMLEDVELGRGLSPSTDRQTEASPTLANERERPSCACLKNAASRDSRRRGRVPTFLPALIADGAPLAREAARARDSDAPRAGVAPRAFSSSPAAVTIRPSIRLAVGASPRSRG